ncbi:hypothetical protein QUF80_13510 [Desulfococcaceae bacterium HSG8]|nr:hypothetical protein [Desulfococcaceae bacterium HSG8]
MSNQMFKFSDLSPAKTLEEVYKVFNPNLPISPDSEYYLPRTAPGIKMLAFHLKMADDYLHMFLCGHRGSGKTTEFKRICMDPEISEKYYPLYLTILDFGREAVNLTHDAVLVEIGLQLVKEGKSFGMKPGLAEELENWGKQIVNTFLHNEEARVEAGAKAGAWFAFFKAQLGTRREWKKEEKQILEPRVQDLIDILNRMAQDLKNKTGKRLLVVVDDLEKGESDSHKEMHTRLFQENYEVLVQPRFSVIYTLPVYYRAIPGRLIPNDAMYAFSAVRLYRSEDKGRDKPPLAASGDGYKLMRGFVESRLADPGATFEEDLLDELLRIGGGLFRETARAIRDAAYFAMTRGSEKIESDDVNKVYNHIKKEYQPIIRGDAIRILKEVMESTQGWVAGVEPYLQSRAVVEYENDDLWIDLRHVLKPYIRELGTADE